MVSPEKWPSPEVAQRQIRELSTLLEPYAAGEEGAEDIVGRVKRLLDVLNDLAPAMAVLGRAPEVAPEIRAVLLEAERKFLGHAQ